MIKILSENGNEKYGICHFTVDTQSGLQNLPTNVEMGSTCFVISTSENYMLNSNEEWIKVNLSGNNEPPTIEVSDGGLITVTAGNDTVTHQLSVEDNENFIASNIKNSINIFGVEGSLNPSIKPTITVTSNGLITSESGEEIETHQLSSADDADFISENIKSGTNIFGVDGTLTPATIPSVGFVPTAYDSSGRITDGVWYGTTVPYSMFYCYQTSAPSAICYLEHITLDSSTTTIAGYAFHNLRSFSSITFSPNLTVIGDHAFDTCVLLSNVIFPNFLTTIGQYAFSSCSSLKSITFPTNLTTLGSRAFQYCSGLTTVTFLSTPNALNGNEFVSCPNLTTINVPWAEGAIAGAPWGATNATINYNYTPS